MKIEWIFVNCSLTKMIKISSIVQYIEEIAILPKDMISKMLFSAETFAANLAAEGIFICMWPKIKIKCIFFKEKRLDLKRCFIKRWRNIIITFDGLQDAPSSCISYHIHCKYVGSHQYATKLYWKNKKIFIGIGFDIEIKKRDWKQGNRPEPTM